MTRNLREDIGKENLYSLNIGMQNNTAILEMSLEVPQKIKIKLPNYLTIQLMIVYTDNFISWQGDICTHNSLLLYL